MTRRQTAHNHPSGGTPPTDADRLALAVLTLVAPGAAVGALLAGLLWTGRATPLSTRWKGATAGLLVFLYIAPGMRWVWPGQLLTGASIGSVVASFVTEALVGPTLLLVWRRLALWSVSPSSPQPTVVAPRLLAGPTPAPSSVIVLGTDTAGRLADIDLVGEASLLVVGLPGTGKTTTLVRLVAETLRVGWTVIVVDLKGSGLMHRAAHVLAERQQVPLYVFDRADPDSLGYNPCAGDPGSITNKLVGAFSFAGVASIYQQVALATLPQVIGALDAAGKPITLTAIVDALEPNALARLGRDAGRKDGIDYEARLKELQARAEKTRVIQEGLVGLQQRLKALDLGIFGDLLRREPALDWTEITARPSLAYLGLSTLGSPPDVELLGRVIAQEFKQLADARLRGSATGPPILLVFDEFAALNEAEQLVDLVLQAREARIVTVASSQFLPKSTPLRKALLGSGVIIAHRVEGDDAEALATQFGTTPTVEMTPTVDFETGQATRGSFRRRQGFTVPPNQLRELGPGQVALRVVRKPLTQRHTIVTVHREEIN